MLDVKIQGNAVLLPVKVVPGSSRDRFAGVIDGRAKVCVAAPPEKGKANKAVIHLLARLLGVHRRVVTVESGHTSSAKTIRIEGISAARVHRALELDPPTGDA